MFKRKENNQFIYITFAVSLFLVLLIFLLWKSAAPAIMIHSGNVKKNQKIVVIDAGHGAEDAGKVGVNGALEKDINFAVAKMLKDMLEAQDVYVKLSRKDERGFYPKSGKNKKVRDLESRVSFINESHADLSVSIHQNAFSDPEVRGAQTFYYIGSKEGRRAAKLLQKQFSILDDENHRKAKENDSYYMLKNVKTPIVIAECGFLSNKEEADLLIQEQYQRKIAWALHLGIMQYLNGGKINEVDEIQN